jgi:hypothetical protein
VLAFSRDEGVAHTFCDGGVAATCNGNSIVPAWDARGIRLSRQRPKFLFAFVFKRVV